MRALLASLVMVSWVASAAAEEPQASAPAWSEQSTTLFFATELTPLATVSTRGDLDAVLRLHRAHGLAIEARLGAAFGFSAIAGASIFGAHLGGALGWSLPLGERLAVTPMAAFDLFVYAQPDTSSVNVRRFTIAAPVTFVAYHHAVVELMIAAGASHVDGTTDLAIVVGPRIGLVF